ncbi:MAG: GNAT family N-acetyltransferase [Desulfobulbaceae bacterium A2]|nr:MAG: GNAT family N-acetyltransferase [Desulfobulbaceae bacterium A2]
MALAGPQPLTAEHQRHSFDCGNHSLNNWLRLHALHAQAGGSARTFVVVEERLVVGYYSLTVGQVETLSAPERIRKGMATGYPIPVVILARLAVHLHFQGRGVGRGLLQDAIRRTLMIANQAGIRALLTHPVNDQAAHFYQRFGFIPSPLREQQLLLLLKDARRFMVSGEELA